MYLQNLQMQEALILAAADLSRLQLVILKNQTLQQETVEVWWPKHKEHLPQILRMQP